MGDTHFAWKGPLFDYEEENGCPGQIKYVFFTDSNGMWRIQTVGVRGGDSFSQRVPLHADWRGLRADELAAKSGIADIKFVHASGFIGGAGSLESVLLMA